MTSLRVQYEDRKKLSFTFYSIRDWDFYIQSTFHSTIFVTLHAV
jgi:hypothetical protein